MPIIVTKNLSKVYQRHRKAEGLLGSLRGLFKRQYEETHAVERASFAIEEGELVGFLGPNGAGKTTTLKMLSGLLHPSEGEAQVMGYVPWQRKNEFRRQFSLVMGNKNQLWFDIPAIESLRLNQKIYDIEESKFRTVVDELGALLDVAKLLEVPVRNLSLGERMKMELLASLIHRPKVLFLDEPTIGLDLISQKKIREFLKEFNQRFRTTILLTSHYMADIQELCQRVLVINGGRLMFDGPLKQIESASGKNKRLRVSFSSPVARERLEGLGKVLENEGPQFLLEVDSSNATALARKLLADFEVADLNIEDVPIEELIRQLFEKTKAPA